VSHRLKAQAGARRGADAERAIAETVNIGATAGVKALHGVASELAQKGAGRCEPASLTVGWYGTALADVEACGGMRGTAENHGCWVYGVWRSWASGWFSLLAATAKTVRLAGAMISAPATTAAGAEAVSPACWSCSRRWRRAIPRPYRHPHPRHRRAYARRPRRRAPAWTRCSASRQGVAVGTRSASTDRVARNSQTLVSSHACVSIRRRGTARRDARSSARAFEGGGTGSVPSDPACAPLNP
jgi:hypothetical protein